MAVVKGYTFCIERGQMGGDVSVVDVDVQS